MNRFRGELVPCVVVLLLSACATGRPPAVCPNALYATDIIAVRDSGTNQPAGFGVTRYADDMLGGTELFLGTVCSVPQSRCHATVNIDSR
jgi:hypothetical protein